MRLSSSTILISLISCGKTTALRLVILLKCNTGFTVALWVSPFPPLPFSLDVFGEADLARKTSLIFEALQGFCAHAQCAPLSNRGNHWCSVGVIPSIACVSVQSTYSWLWGQLTLLFISLFITEIHLPIFEEKYLKVIRRTVEIRFLSSPRGFILSRGFLD